MTYCDYNFQENSQLVENSKNQRKLSSLSREVLLKRKHSIDVDVKSFSQFKKFEDAIKKFKQLFHSSKKIGLFSDYDCDGLLSAEAFRYSMNKLGKNYAIYIPNRNQKYGLSKEGIQLLLDNNCDLLLTSDCGINDIDEIDFAKSLGMSVVITDHHLRDYELTNNADVIIDPEPQEEPLSLSGCCVLCFVLSELGIAIHEFVRYIGVTSISDCMPMIGYSRYFVRKLFELDNICTNNDLVSIASYDSSRLSLSEIGWKIVPKINAISRMNCITDLRNIWSQDIKESSEYLNVLNAQRKTELNELFNQYQYYDCNAIGIGLLSENIKAGMYGLFASRLVAKYKKPMLVGSIEEKTKIFRGSGRSNGLIDLHAYLKKCKLGKNFQFGGHSDALGFKTSKKLDKVIEKLKKTTSQGCEVQLKDDIIDFEVFIDELDTKAFPLDALFYELFPFGVEFQFVSFRVRGIEILEFKKPQSWLWYWSAQYKNLEFRIDDLALYELEMKQKSYLDVYLLDIEQNKKKILVTKSFI